MLIKSAEFICSNTDHGKAPQTELPEYPFIGRSNVGKSSLINMLCRRKNLAKTSQIPGKTQLINHFLINNEWYLVDLPGYGYAKISKSKAAAWQKFSSEYLKKRHTIACIFVLIDSRLKPQRADMEFIGFLGDTSLPFVLVFTKADKQSDIKTKENINLFKNDMLNTWEKLPNIFLTSSVNSLGRDDVLSFIAELNNKLKTKNRC